MAVLIYLFKSAAILSLFFMAYTFLLKNETFFKANRHFLLGGIFAAFVVPFLILKRTVYKELPPVNFDIPEELLLQASNGVEESFDFWQLVLLLYALGVVVMLFLFSKKLIQIFYFLKNSNQETSNGYHFVQINGLEAPFSFFNYIVLDAQSHSEEELEMIILHEKAHSNQRHSLDMFLVQFVLITQWFNPLAWLYKNAVVQNLEYLADATTVSQIENRKNYQLALVKVAVPKMVPELTHSFYQSFIKKRIVMLNKQSSSEFKKFKMLLILPVLAGFMWSFNVKEEVKFKTEPLSSSEKKETENTLVVLPKSNEDQNKENLSVISDNAVKQPVKKKVQDTPKPFKKVITSEMTKEEIEQLSEELAADYNIEMGFSKLRYNSEGNLTSIKLILKDTETNNQTSTSYNSDQPINDILIYRTKEGVFGVTSTSSSIVQETGIISKQQSKLQKGIHENEKRKAEQEALRQEKVELQAERVAENVREMAVRREEMKNRLNDSTGVTAKMKERMVEMELRKAEMEARKREFINKQNDSVFYFKRKITNASQNDKAVNFYKHGVDLESKVLFILNGEEINEYEFKMINPEDIESINILKGDNANALYKDKMKGKNGVMLITTKINKK